MTKRKRDIPSCHINKKVNNIIIYREEYYNIDSIENENSCLEKIIIKNSLKNYEKTREAFSSKSIGLCSDNKGITYLLSSEIKEVRAIINYINQYNSTIQYINNRKGGGYDLLTSADIDYISTLKNDNCRLTIQKLYRIMYHLKKTHDSTYQIKNIKKNPYSFITEDVCLITFLKAERIEEYFQLQLDFKIKCSAFVYSTILSNNNSFYMKKTIFDNKKCKKFCIDNYKDYNKYKRHIYSIIKIRKYIEKKQLRTGFSSINRDDVITTNYLYNKECNITNTTMKLFYDEDDNSERMSYNSATEKSDIDKHIENCETQHKFPLEKEQKYAIQDFFLNPARLKIITGPPGSGKTAIVKCILKINRELYKKDKYNAINPEHISLMAPTGLAFSHIKNDQESNHYNAEISGTCHRTVYHTYQKKKSANYNNSIFSYDEDDRGYDENSKLKFGLILIDESSMLDMHMFGEILEICKQENSKLILIGDVDQLPSVGPGDVFKTLINLQFADVASKCFDVNELTKIKRQDGGALINAIYKMKRGENISEKDFDNETFIYQERKPSDTLDKLIPNIIDRYKLNKNTSKVLCYNSGEKHMFTPPKINIHLQNIYNPCNDDLEHDIIPPPDGIFNNNGNIFRLEDKIIRTENDYSNDNMRANGDQAIITQYDGEKIMIDYNDEDKPEEISRDRLYQEFALNYSTNIHKAQGSQYDDIVLLIEPGVTFIKRDAFYTAISRAKKRCIIVTMPSDLDRCQNPADSCISFFLKDTEEYQFEII
jgi:exodeoxyribonuclease V alpha subunit